jgi:hypothetical protein
MENSICFGLGHQNIVLGGFMIPVVFFVCCQPIVRINCEPSMSHVSCSVTPSPVARIILRANHNFSTNNYIGFHVARLQPSSTAWKT